MASNPGDPIWTTLSTGVIIPPGAATYTTLTGAQADRCEAGIARWGEKFRMWGQGVDWRLLIAMARQESGFNPNARNPEGTPDPSNDGIGLFQITNKALKGSRTDAQLMDPQTNVIIASNYILDLQKRYGATANDIPKICAAFNAGSVHAPFKGFENRWNMHCTPGHIDSEVMTWNYCVLREQPSVDLGFDELDPDHPF